MGKRVLIDSIERERERKTRCGREAGKWMMMGFVLIDRVMMMPVY